jgi:hypothetical protein
VPQDAPGRAGRLKSPPRRGARPPPSHGAFQHQPGRLNESYALPERGAFGARALQEREASARHRFAEAKASLSGPSDNRHAMPTGRSPLPSCARVAQTFRFRPRGQDRMRRGRHPLAAPAGTTLQTAKTPCNFMSHLRHEVAIRSPREVSKALPIWGLAIRQIPQSALHTKDLRWFCSPLPPGTCGSDQLGGASNLRLHLQQKVAGLTAGSTGLAGTTNRAFLQPGWADGAGNGGVPWPGLTH